MAKQSKKVIDQRKAELITAGYTEEELSRPDILESIENTTAGNWPGVAEGLKKTKEDSLIPLTEAEHIPNEETGDTNKGPGTTLVVTMDVIKDVAALTVDTNKEAIELWVKTYAGLKFTNLEDVDTITKIREGKKLAQKCRIAVTKRETFLKAPYIAGSKKIKEVADEYVALLAKIEDPLDVQIELIKKAEEADKIKKAEEAEAEGTRRVEVLKEAGIKFDGQFYCIGETISMDYASLKAKTPEDFEKFVILVQDVKKMLDDQAAKELEQLKEQRLRTRGNMLVSIGMVCSAAGSYSTELIPSVTILNGVLTDETDDRFMVLFSSLSGRIADAKKKIEDDKDKKAKERTVNMRSKLILAAGMMKVDWIPGTTQTGFYFKNEFAELKLTLLDVQDGSDDFFDCLIESAETEIKEAKAKAIQKEADDKAAELLAKDRREQLVELGLINSPQTANYVFSMPNVNMKCTVDYSALQTMEEGNWNRIIVYATGTIADIKKKQKEFEDKAEKDKKEKDEKEAADSLIFQSRQYALVNLGMVIVGMQHGHTVDQFFLRNEFGDVAKITVGEVKVIDEDAWPGRLTEVTQAVEQVKKLTAEKRQAAAKKMEDAKPQVEKVKDYLLALLQMDAPVVEDPELNLILTVFEEDLIAITGKASVTIDRKVNAAQPVTA